MPFLTDILVSFLLALGISLIALPETVRVIKKINLPDKLYVRIGNSIPVPELGGIAIFFSFVLASAAGLYNSQLPEFTYILGAVLLIFFVGLKDDIITHSSFNKLLVQVIVSFILVLAANMRITNLHGLFGIGATGTVASIIISCFTILACLNALKAISGINGLIIGQGIMITLVLGIWFAISGHSDFAVLSFSLTGSISGLLLYNLFFPNKKIGMGEPGSLVIGTIISVLVIRFNEFNIDQSLPFTVDSAPLITFLILSYPLSESARNMILGFLEDKSGSKSCSNRPYHRLVALGFSEQGAAVAITSINSLLIISAFVLLNRFILWLMVLAVIAGILFEITVFYVRERQLQFKRNLANQLKKNEISDNTGMSGRYNPRRRKQWAEPHVVNFKVLPQKSNPG